MLGIKLQKAVEYLKQYNLKVVTAESCTAGLIASTLAELPGCGQWLECAFVTYSENAKIDCLHVAPELINQYGLTSEEVATAMSVGALAASKANLAISTTGVAGPAAGDDGKPVGTVCFGWTFRSLTGDFFSYSETCRFDGERNEVREAAVTHALEQVPMIHHLALESQRN